MSCVEVPTASRAEWLIERRKGLGGSDVSAVLGMSRWNSPRDIWLDKTGRGSTHTDSWPIRRGNALEPALIEWFTDTTGLGCVKPPMQRSVETPWMQVSPDGFVDDGGLLECKTAAWRMRHEWEDGASDHASLQGQWGLAITGRTHLYVIAAIGDDEPVVERIERDDALIATMVEACGRFWHDYVEADVEPPLMWLDRDTLAREFPTVERARADGNDEVDDWIERRAAITETIKAATKTKERAEAMIIAALGDADHLVINGRIAATRKAQTSRVVDMDALAEGLAYHGDSLDNYRIERASRVLRIPDPAKRKEWKD